MWVVGAIPPEGRPGCNTVMIHKYFKVEKYTPTDMAKVNNEVHNGK